MLLEEIKTLRDRLQTIIKMAENLREDGQYEQCWKFLKSQENIEGDLLKYFNSVPCECPDYNAVTSSGNKVDQLKVYYGLLNKMLEKLE